MSVLLFEGFETVGTELGLANQATTRPRIALRWDAVGSGGAPTTDSFFVITDGFSEGYAIQMGQNGFSNGNFLEYAIPSGKGGVGASATEFVVGWRVHVPSTSRSWSMFHVRANYGTGTGSIDFSVNVSNSADLTVSRLVAGVFATATGVFSTDQWHHVEVKFSYSSGSSTNGSYDIYVDGVQQLVDATARINGNFFSNLRAMRFNTTNASTGQDYIAYDDIYILEADGQAPNDFLGAQVRIVSLPPDADGTTTDWTTSTGSDHYALVDENGASASDYVETSTDTEQDMFETTDTSSGGVFHALKVEAEAIAQTTTSHTLDVRVDSNGTVEETSHSVTSTTAYDVFSHYSNEDPDASAAWTQSAVDAAEVGVQFNT